MSTPYIPQQPYNNDSPQQPGQVYPQQPMYPPGYQPPMMQQPMKPRKARRWPWIIALIVVFFIGMAIGTSLGSSNSTSKSGSTSTAQPGGGTSPQPTSAPAAPASTGKWTTTHTYSGNGIKKTEIITVPSDWKINYTCKGDNVSGTAIDGVLGVTVTNSDNTPADVAVNATCKGNNTAGSTEEHAAGQVFLDVNATGDWTLQIQELK